ncbi:MAG: gliding motility-associated C-terminal domain-containing protein [Bacteroidia bacterium]
MKKPLLFIASFIISLSTYAQTFYKDSVKATLDKYNNYHTFIGVTPAQLQAKNAIDPTYESRLFEKSLSTFYGFDITKFVASNAATFNSKALLVTYPEQQCNSAIPVCQNNYAQNTSYSGEGTSQEIPGNSSCLGSQEKNSVWYTFTSQTAGSLNMTINSSVDYDWALYDITGGSCADIASGATTPVRCNFSATAGNTGLSSAGSNNSEGSGGSPFSNPLNVVANHTFVLIVSNYSSTATGYTLDFSGGTANIFDNNPPLHATATSPCGSNIVDLTFQEPIKCTTIAADGSDFILTGTGGPYVINSAVGLDCGTSSLKVQLTTTPPLTGGGPWSIDVQAGTDGNTLTDLCGNATPTGTILINNVAPAASAVVITGTDTACKGALAVITASAGTGYSWTNPSGTVIGTTQSISVPTTAVGTITYSVTVQNGSCPAATGTKTVQVLPGVESDFTFAPTSICAGQAINFTNTSLLPGLCGGLSPSFCTNIGSSCGFLTTCQAGQYTDSEFDFVWNFGDGSPAASGRPGNQTHTYATAGTYTVSMQGKGEITGLFGGLFGGGGVACNNIKTQTITVLPNTNTLSVRADKIICPGDTFHLKASGGASYTWKDSATGTTIGITNDEVVSPTKTTKYYVETPGCGGVITKDSITVTVNGQALVLTPKFPGICIGDSIDLTSNFPANWTSSPAGFSATGQMLVNVKPIVPTKYYCTYTNANGCVLRDSTFITVSGTPFTILPQVTPYTCGSVPPNGAINILIGGASGISFAWADSTTNAVIPNTTSVLNNVTDGGYLLTVTANGCRKTKYIHVPVGGLPTITTNYITKTLCKGDTAILVANGTSNYNWQTNPAIVTLLSTNSVLVQPLVNTTITVDGYNTTLACKVTQVITLNVLPNPIIALTPNAAAICNGDSILITMSGGSQYGYDLVSTFPNNITPIAGSSFYLSPAATTNYMIAGLDINQCPDTAVLTLTVNATPTFALASAQTLICEDSSAVLTATGALTNVYTWSPATGLSTTTGATVTATPVVKITYTVVASDPATSCVKKDSITITTKPKPLADAGKNVAICEGKKIKLSAAGGQKYTWSPKLGLSDSTIFNPVASPQSTTTYNVLVELNGCVDTANVQVTILATSPIQAYGDTTILIGESTQIVVQGATTGTYTWTPSTEIPCITCMQNNVKPKETTRFIVTYVDLNGCIQKDTVLVNVNTDYGIYVPNAFTVDGNNLNDLFKPIVWGVKSYELKVFDRWGLLVYDGSETQQGWKGDKNGVDAPQDVYIYALDVLTNKGSRVRKTGTITMLR